jgi:hypothetical protein
MQRSNSSSYQTSPLSSPRILPNPPIVNQQNSRSSHDGNNYPHYPYPHLIHIHPDMAKLKQFLDEAPIKTPNNVDRYVLTYNLDNGENINCILWSGKHYVTGTDIVKILLYRFQKFNRPVMNVKKFEEGVFSDLRMLKHNSGATLEEPRSPFLEYLYRNNCIRTQKKQKVFYWESVAHDTLFMDALERDLKRESNLHNINQLMIEQRKQREILYAQLNDSKYQAALMGYHQNQMLNLPPNPTLAPNINIQQGLPYPQQLLFTPQSPQLSPTVQGPPSLGVNPTEVFQTSAGLEPHPILNATHQRSLSEPENPVRPQMEDNIKLPDPLQFFEENESLFSNTGSNELIRGSDPLIGSTIPGTEYSLMHE